MLLILCGPTGSGRSAIIKHGAARYGWRPVRWVTTRAPRPDEIDRVSVPNDEFEAQVAAGQLFYTFEFFDNQYGVRCDEIARAAHGSEVYAMDLLPSSLLLFPPVDAAVVGIRSTMATDLYRQLAAAGRVHRGRRAAFEERLLRDSPLVRAKVQHTVVNEFGRIEAATAEIARYLGFTDRP